jgi:hypothetical protein
MPTFGEKMPIYSLSVGNGLCGSSTDIDSNRVRSSSAGCEANSAENTDRISKSELREIARALQEGISGDREHPKSPIAGWTPTQSAELRHIKYEIRSSSSSRLGKCSPSSAGGGAPGPASGAPRPIAIGQTRTASAQEIRLRLVRANRRGNNCAFQTRRHWHRWCSYPCHSRYWKDVER